MSVTDRRTVLSRIAALAVAAAGSTSLAPRSAAAPTVDPSQATPEPPLWKINMVHAALVHEGDLVYCKPHKHLMGMAVKDIHFGDMHWEKSFQWFNVEEEPVVGGEHPCCGTCGGKVQYPGIQDSWPD